MRTVDVSLLLSLAMLGSGEEIACDVDVEVIVYEPGNA
jgi:hypothetical protein